MQVRSLMLLFPRVEQHLASLAKWSRVAPGKGQQVPDRGAAIVVLWGIREMTKSFEGNCLPNACPVLSYWMTRLEPKKQGEYRVAEEAWDSKSTKFTLLLNSDSPKLGYHNSRISTYALLTRRTAYDVTG